MSIKILDNFITVQEASSLRTLLYGAPWYGDIKNKAHMHNFHGVFWNGGPVNNIEKTDARNLLLERIIDSKLVSIFKDNNWQFNNYLTGLYFLNDFQGYHCQTHIPTDGFKLGSPSISGYNCFNGYPLDWKSSTTPNRSYVCHIFINKNFEGGNCSFPLQGIDVEPMLGRAVIYPADRSCLYGVRPITNGYRLTLTTFFE